MIDTPFDIRALRYGIFLEGQTTAIRGVFVERTGPTSWVLRDGEGYCFTKSGDWLCEPAPSSRTDEFLVSTRFGNPWEAASVWLQHNPSGDAPGAPSGDTSARTIKEA